MQLDVNVVLTLVTAIVVLIVGRMIVARVGFLNKYSIPDPVVGGLIAAVVITGLRFGAGLRSRSTCRCRARCCWPSSPPSASAPMCGCCSRAACGW